MGSFLAPELARHPAELSAGRDFVKKLPEGQRRGVFTVSPAWKSPERNGDRRFTRTLQMAGSKPAIRF